MLRQQSFLDEPREEPSIQSRVAISDPSVSDSDKPRLKGQCLAVHSRLKQGPATNFELSQICLNYRGRIHNLRQAGFKIQTTKGEGPGVFIFTLDQG